MLWFKKKKVSWEKGRTHIRRDPTIRKETWAMFKIFLRAGKSRRSSYEDVVEIHGKGYYAQ